MGEPWTRTEWLLCFAAGYLWAALCVWVAMRAERKSAADWIGRWLPYEPVLLELVVVLCFWWLAPIMQHAVKRKVSDLEWLARRSFRRKLGLEIMDELARDADGPADQPQD